jgi:tyrosinase
MDDKPAEEPVVDNPTYMGHIRYFFEQIDIDHMGAKGIELGTYDGVKLNALAIFAHTAPPDADMPPEADRKWSAARSQTFKNWIRTGYPVGTANAEQPARMALEAAPGRLRKNVNSLNGPEIDALRKAFSGILAKDTSDPGSYYAIASIHGLPPPTYCLHHEDRYNPWHRVYLKMFEDALRSVPGCENVTLPYWDIRTPIPDLLKTAPFDSYVIPLPISGLPANYKTERSPQATIDADLARRNVVGHLNRALNQSVWGRYGRNGYQDESIAAHDGGHLSIGPTMADQDIASYDPIFWFFHCNLDRHFLKWQGKIGAGTLAGFKSTLQGNIDWLTPGFNLLNPFPTTADQAIEFGIAYEEPPEEESVAMAAFENKVGSVEATRTFTIPRSPDVSVMVKDIDRLSIPGSFVVQLLADGKPVAERAFFQPKQPRECANCRKQGLISVNFRVEQERIVGRKLSIAIEVPSQQESIGARFPLSAVGNPTINVRLLLEDG